MIVRNFKLYLHAGASAPLVINANQYDHNEQWVFELYDSNNQKYTPSTGAIVGIKSDGLGIINTATVDSNGRVVVNETEQMTAAAGRAEFELMIDSAVHGTANFYVLVEPKPGDNADLSETDISMIEQAIEAASTIKPYGSPLVASTVAGMTDHDKVYVYVGSETGYTSGNWYYWDGSAWTSGGVYNSVAVQTDTTLTLSGVAADAKKTGDEISDLRSAIQQSGGLTADVKQALENLLEKVAYIDGNGQTYLDALHTAMYPPANLTRITAVYTQSGTVYDTDSLDDLKADLVVTAFYDNSTSEIVSTYTLSGTLAEGTSTITVSYGGKTTTFNVTVTHVRTVDYTDGYIDDNGEIVSATNNYVSNNYDAVTAGDFVQVQNFSPASSVRVAEYDSSKNFIKRSFQTQSELHNGQSYKLADNTAFVRMGFVTTAPDNSFADYVVCDAPTNLNYYVGKDINTSTGELQDNANRAVTDFIPASGTTIGIGANSTTAMYYTARCYDSNKSFLGSATTSGLSKVGTPTATGASKTLVSNTAFVRITLGLNSTGTSTMTNVYDDCDFAVGFSDSAANKLFKLVNAS